MISKQIPKWFMAGDIAFVSERIPKKKIDIWFFSTCAPKVNRSLLSMMCLESWSSAEF